MRGEGPGLKDHSPASIAHVCIWQQPQVSCKRKDLCGASDRLDHPYGWTIVDTTSMYSTTKRPPTTSGPLVRPSMLKLRSTAGVGVGISGACRPPLVWRARKPLPWALSRPPSLPASRGSAPPCLSTVFRSWVSACAPNGCSLSFVQPSSLFYFFAFSARACRFQVTVTSVSFTPLVSHHGLFNSK